jgi:hypothetical protein
MSTVNLVATSLYACLGKVIDAYENGNAAKQNEILTDLSNSLDGVSQTTGVTLDTLFTTIQNVNNKYSP